MSNIIPVQLQIHLPAHAQLPRLRQALGDLCGVLDRALEPMRAFRRERGDLDNDLRLAVAVHAMSALQAAKALHTLSDTDHADTVPGHFRTLFDALVKIRWMRKNPLRARRYLQSQPFEQYALATDRVKKSDKWAGIVEACKTAVAQDPTLLELPGATKGPKKRPDFAAIASELRMDLKTMTKALGMDEDDYLIDQGFPSLAPHTSVLYTQSFMKGVNADGTARLSTDIDPHLLQAFVGRGATRTGEVLNEVFELWPDGALMFESENIAKRLEEGVAAVSMRLT